MTEKVKPEGLIDINILEKFVIQINENGQIDKMTNFGNNTKEKKEKKLKGKKNKIEFISVNKESSEFITENEIYLTLNVNKTGITKRTGKYQESLYHHYISAKIEKDNGYMLDVLEKIQTLKANIEETKILMKNKSFMKIWRRNYGNFTPVQLLRNTGNFRTINIIKELI